MVLDIYFYSNKEEYGWLSNFERSEEMVDGIIYQTNEHYYQSEKAVSKDIKEWIINAPSPYLAMKAGRSLREKELYPGWNDVKFYVMYVGLVAKFTQNPVLKEKLLNTGSANLHEDSPDDLIWGVKGEDRLGKLLMKVREELRVKE